MENMKPKRRGPNKMTKEMLERIETFVAARGLYPQPCGAPIAELCRECGISDETFARWSKKVEFVDLLTRAREKFAQTTEVNVVNALVKAAQGVDFVQETQEGKAQVVKEYDPKTGKLVKEYTTDKMVTTKAKKVRVYYPPDVRAAQFLLTNVAPDRWKLKQDQAIQAEVTQYVVKDEQEKKKLENIGEGDV